MVSLSKFPCDQTLKMVMRKLGNCIVARRFYVSFEVAGALDVDIKYETQTFCDYYPFIGDNENTFERNLTLLYVWLRERAK